MGRLALIWLLLFGVFAATLVVPGAPGREHVGNEALHLEVTEALVENGELLEAPTGIGLPLLIAPAYALGGETGAELFLAALAALAFTLAIPLARRLVPDPWATRGPLLAGLSAPALGACTSISGEFAAAALLAGATILALRLRERPRVRWAAGAALLLAAVPWLAPQFALPGLLVGGLLVRWLLRRHRAFPAFVAGEIAFASGIAYLTVNERLYGTAIPGGSVTTGAETVAEYAERTQRIGTLLVDPDAGLLRWAPFFALTGLAAWLLWRSRREKLARALADRVDVEISAGVLFGVAGAVGLAAAFLAPSVEGPWFAARHVVPALPFLGALCAWGLRHAPRVGGALAAISLLLSVGMLALGT